MSTYLACPHCRVDLRRSARVSLYEITSADANPEADLILHCAECGRRWNAFVAVREFLDNPIGEES